MVKLTWQVVLAVLWDFGGSDDGGTAAAATTRRLKRASPGGTAAERDNRKPRSGDAECGWQKCRSA